MPSQTAAKFQFDMAGSAGCDRATRLRVAHVEPPPGELLHLAHGGAQLVAEPAGVAFAEHDGERSVVPELVDRAGVEPLPRLGTVPRGGRRRSSGRSRARRRPSPAAPASACRGRGGGRGTPPCGAARSTASRAAGRLRRELAVERLGAALDDPRDLAAEPLADLLRLHVRVLDRVVQQRGDGLGLGAAVVEHQRGDVEQVGDVGDVAALAGLRAVQLGGPLDRTPRSAVVATSVSSLRALATFFSCSDSVTA